VNETCFLTAVSTDHQVGLKVPDLFRHQKFLYFNMKAIRMIDVDVRSPADKLPIKELPKTARKHSSFEAIPYDLKQA